MSHKMPDTKQSDDYDDMPALMCGRCHGVTSLGGVAWEREHPSTVFCYCRGYRRRTPPRIIHYVEPELETMTQD